MRASVDQGSCGVSSMLALISQALGQHPRCSVLDTDQCHVPLVRRKTTCFSQRAMISPDDDPSQEAGVLSRNNLLAPYSAAAADTH